MLNTSKIKLILFDKQNFESDFVRTISVEDLIKEVESKGNDGIKRAFISSANSLLFMDGGSDLGYTRSISNIEKLCKNGLKEISGLGRKYLPIGNSLGFKIPGKHYYFISCPTMFLPQKVEKTNNSYHALQAGLEICHFLGIDEVYCPMMCTSWGCMTFEQSLIQMKNANDNRADDGEISHDGSYIYFSRNNSKFKEIINEQPKIYPNTEFYVDIGIDVGINLPA